tara:strand:+ start:4078 stop:4485 length:408 start_codon:yes stop_codon:yes gene_type:complete
MIFSITDDRTGSVVRFFLKEPLAKANRYVKKQWDLSNDDVFHTENNHEGVSYFYRGKAVVWVCGDSQSHDIHFQKVLLHELLHVCFHLDKHWEDDEPPEQYDVCLKSEANFIELAESLYGKVLIKIKQYNKKKRK